ncbi:MAG: hypothetical protein NTZ69_01290 [Bacteroidia bacterium]|nr:hypothetical protein [Bacteroidia bacterium]
MTENSLRENYRRNEKHFLRIIEFVKNNKEVKQGIDRFFNSALLICKSNAKEKVRILYIQAISAAGGSNLTRNGKSCKEFSTKIDKLGDEQQIELKDFFRCFETEINSFTDLFKHISHNNLNFGPKKAALFLNKMDWVQRNIDSGQQIFKDYNIDVMDLMIPIDNVIIRILNEIICINCNEQLDQYRDFAIINQFFKEKLGSKFMLIEDLWFWGYFSTKGNGNNRIIEFNEDKFYTAEFLKPTVENRNRISEFIKILKND